MPKDDRGPLDLTRQIGELQCEIAGLKTKVHDAELETSLVKAIGINSPEMKAARAEITELKETLMRACQYNIISIGNSKVNWIQGDNRPIITHVPLGVKGVDHMAQYCMSEKGQSTLEHIKLMLSKLN